MPKRYTNYIIAPFHFKGTSFEDIIRSLTFCLDEVDLNIRYLDAPIASKNNLTEMFDNDQYFKRHVSCLSHILEILQSDTKLLFLDFFNPGLDIIKYHCQLKNITPKFGSLLHGSAFLAGDLYSWDWLRHYELGWLNSYDTIYCPSKFLKRALPVFKAKTKVFPWGIDGISFQNTSRKLFDVAFPHRLEVDKGVIDFIEITQELKTTNFLITCPQEKTNISQNKYYRELAKQSNVTFKYGQNYNQHLRTLSQCKVVLSCAKQENFGYSILKAVKSGAIPVLPNRLSYQEMYASQYLYSNRTECIKLITTSLKNGESKIKLNRTKQVDYSFKPLLLNFFK